MSLDHFKLFTGWENEQLRELAAALDAASGEGVVCRDLAEALVAVAEHREIRLSYAYDGEQTDPAAWLRNYER